jgi:hypothetical protein
MFSSLGSISRLCSVAPRLSRSLVNRAASRPVPPPRGNDLLPPASPHKLTTPVYTEAIATPTDFLKAIGRSAETKVTAESWNEFWKTSGHQLKKSGLAVRDRRYKIVHTKLCVSSDHVTLVQIHPVVYGELPQWATNSEFCSRTEAKEDDTRVCDLLVTCTLGSY